MNKEIELKLFKTVDQKLRDIGFVKIKEDNYGANYERLDERYGYVQCLSLVHKISGRHLIQSYQQDINQSGFYNMVGLTMDEAKLAIKKMKQMGFKEMNS